MCKSYGEGETKVDALSDITFEVNQQEFVSIIGPSGCGKSTLLRLIAGLLPKSGGEIEVSGKPVEGPIKGVGMVFQTPVLLDWRRVVGNVLLPSEFLKLDKKMYAHKARELLKFAGLDGFEDKYPFELSGGMQQRVALCRALLLDPHLLLMDEPFGALDALTRERMNFELQRLWSETRKTVVFVTHSIQEAIFLSDRIVVMTPRPGKVSLVLKNELPRPRDSGVTADKKFTEYANVAREALGITSTINITEGPM